eukprot:CAMPEP_0172652144 /NCGR_PEP_ID=MMETSP1068-20121228/243166_1 /TAXON_ID=35684 /ORGANISM="Pseudopedinella elastica, Strain CCMP716" /LENGTH=136 /DNA_ID=CAMNT_0013466549 /DNA_START=1219 /DNA_END=1629 /DNA_ORIENTATION=-
MKSITAVFLSMILRSTREDQHACGPLEGDSKWLPSSESLTLIDATRKRWRGRPAHSRGASSWPACSNVRPVGLEFPFVEPPHGELVTLIGQDTNPASTTRGPAMTKGRPAPANIQTRSVGIQRRSKNSENQKRIPP